MDFHHLKVEQTKKLSIEYLFVNIDFQMIFQ